MKHPVRFILGFSLLLQSLSAAAQQVDTLESAVATARQQPNYISKGKDLRTEVISSAGLMKMACCNLAESFENSASVTVGYADATTGARQIRLLGLSGIYTQMLDENRPVLRGIVAPFALSYEPGSWLESIQVGKGSPSVVGGTESITGSINLEHAKPTDGKPLFVNASVMSDTKTDLNVLSSLAVTDNLYTVLLGHADGNFTSLDMNGDGFADDPRQLQLNFGNRWLWYSPSLQLRWGVKAVRDRRQGGQLEGPWKSAVGTTALNGYFKAGYALREDNSASIALVADYAYTGMDASFGNNLYNALQHSAFLNLIYRNKISDRHDVTAGIDSFADWITESVQAGGQDLPGEKTRLLQLAPYAEYTFHDGERFSLIAGFSGTFFPGRGFYPSPRLTLKYQPASFLVLRANGGRGVRAAHPVADNIGILSTGKQLLGSLTARPLEDAWTVGGNATFYLGDAASLSLDYFHTRFCAALLTDREAPSAITLYTLDGHSAYSHTFQADFSWEPINNLSFSLTGRYTDARAWQPSGKVREIPLQARFKGVFNAQYKLGAGKWIFDFTASLVGSARVYDFMRELRDSSGMLLYPEGRTPVYPLLYAQITKRFRGFDIYIGGENLSGSMQMHPIVEAADPFSPRFDAASVWGPLMGAKFYAGFRITIWN